jgi:hypothetical protein
MYLDPGVSVTLRPGWSNQDALPVILRKRLRTFDDDVPPEPPRREPGDIPCTSPRNVMDTRDVEDMQGIRVRKPCHRLKSQLLFARRVAEDLPVVRGVNAEEGERTRHTRIWGS